jgi:hypothetical protein
MRTLGALGAICLFSLLGIASLQAADRAQSWPLHLGSTILGSSVQNLQGEELGTLHDLVVNPADNRVVYGVLASGGLLGLGKKLFAVPLSALKRTAEVDTLLLDMDQERLKQAPEFNPHNWPQMTDRQWIASVYTFYGLQPYWE